MAERGTALVPTRVQVDNFPTYAAAGEARFPRYAAHMRDLHARADTRPAGGLRGRRADLRRHRRRRRAPARPDRSGGGSPARRGRASRRTTRWAAPRGGPATGSASRVWWPGRRPTSCCTTRTRWPTCASWAPPPGWSCAAASSPDQARIGWVRIGLAQWRAVPGVRRPSHPLRAASLGRHRPHPHVDRRRHPHARSRSFINRGSQDQADALGQDPSAVLPHRRRRLPHQA